MRLSKLKLAGFKTFVDPTTILFPGNLVGVVGPNGCGKSNIIDAVRWVLGESRASALRGESMQDVIFNGSTARKPVSRASVELVFDNTSGGAGGQWSRYGEISVKRVLDRSGESSYLINNVQVRRKDVIDLFLGTGLGPRAYAIIEQGMISRLIEARPEEIRGFLEEAAGVTKYRERRKETEGRLRDARDNLARIDDICSELAERIGHLEVQAEIAARHRRLSSSHQEKQQLLWLLKRNEAQHEELRLQTLAQHTGQRIEAHNARLQELEATLETARAAHFDASESVHLAQSEMYGARAEVSRLESELQHLGATRQRIETRLHQLELDQHHWQERAASLVDEHARWLAQAESAALHCTQAQARHDELAQQLPEHEAERAAAESALAAVRQQLAVAERAQQVEEAKRASAERALASLTQRRTRLDAEQQALLIPDEEAQLQCEARLEALQSTLEQVQAALALAQHELPARQAGRKDAHQQERAARDRLASCQARRQALEQLQARVHGSGELGDWLQQHQLQQLQPLWRSLRVSAGWEEAVQAVLRERIAALHGSAPEAAARLLQQPPPASLSLILALDAEIPDRVAALAPFADLTPLADEVEVLDHSLRALLAQLLQGVFCVATLEPYLCRHAQLPPGSWLVNRHGQLLGRGLLCHLAADASTAGIIEREREIDGLAAEQELLAAAAAQAQEDAHEADLAIAALEERISHQRRELQQLQSRLHDEQLAALKLSQERERAVASAQRMQRELEEVRQLESTEQQHCSEAERALQDIDQQVEQQRGHFDRGEQHLQSCNHALHQLRAVEQAAARAAQEAQFAVRECKGRIEDSGHHRQLAAEQMERIAADVRLHRSELEACVDEASKEALQQALQQLKASEDRLGQRRDELEMAASHLKQTEELRLRTEQEAAPERSQLAELRLAIQASALTVSQYRERLQEAEADEAALQPLLHAELKESSLQREVSRLAREISELGAVNMAALEELNAAVQRKSYLDEQSSDLLQAIDTLEGAIRRIDRETREQLQTTFDTVNAHFGELFPQLFGGGRAELVLTGDEILDAGVHIVAQPPGKKNTSIHLLSGGEKALTAIALVFAMFQLNPAPFCMLDEVDAPLDDSNTERYAGMVKRMSMHTQFIFISHSKITMEYAQQLVGVTMQEQGVSRVVEVDIEQALRLAEPAAA